MDRLTDLKMMEVAHLEERAAGISVIARADR